MRLHTLQEFRSGESNESTQSREASLAGTAYRQSIVPVPQGKINNFEKPELLPVDQAKAQGRNAIMTDGGNRPECMGDSLRYLIEEGRKPGSRFFSC